MRKKEPYRTGGPSKDPTRHNAPYWCKWYELVTDKEGSREVPKTRWFPTLTAADEYGRSVSGIRADVRSFTDQERLQALHFFRECEARNLSPFDVFTAGLRHYKAESAKPMTLEQAKELYSIWMISEEYSSVTIANREGSLNWLIRQTDGNRLLSTFTAEELSTFVKTRYDNHDSQTGFLRDLRSFFAWGARNGYCHESTAKNASLSEHKMKSSVRKSSLRRANKRPPRLRADQVKACFDAVDPRYHAALALAIFAGLRPQSELPRIEWKMIDRGQTYGVDFQSRTIHLHDTWSSKTFMERTLHDLPAPLWNILERHRKEEGPILGCNYRNYRNNIIDPIKKALGYAELPNDIFRHTALSFQYALIGAAGTQNNAGHTDMKTFQAHYNNAVGKAEAELFQTLEI